MRRQQEIYLATGVKETCCFEFFNKRKKVICGKPAAYFTKINGVKKFLCAECALSSGHFVTRFSLHDVPQDIRK